jgi:hypothetical protein
VLKNPTEGVGIETSSVTASLADNNNGARAVPRRTLDLKLELCFSSMPSENSECSI